METFFRNLVFNEITNHDIEFMWEHYLQVHKVVTTNLQTDCKTLDMIEWLSKTIKKLIDVIHVWCIKGWLDPS